MLEIDAREFYGVKSDIKLVQAFKPVEAEDKVTPAASAPAPASAPST